MAANGDILTPYFVVKGVDPLEQRFENQQPISADYRFTTSLPGYSSDELAYDSLQFFQKQTKNRVLKGEKRLLLMNGHGPHLTYKFISFCDRNTLFLTAFASYVACMPAA